MDPSPQPTPTPTDTPSMARQVFRRILPYIWRRRWILVLTIFFMWTYSVGVTLRNIIPALFFDGILVSDGIGGESVLSSYVRPISQWLGFVDEEQPRPFAVRGGFRNLVITDHEKILDLDRVADGTGPARIANGIASFELLGPPGHPGSIGPQPPGAIYDRVPFTTLRVEVDAPDRDAFLDAARTASPLSIPSGLLELEHKAVTVDMGLLSFIFVFGLMVCLVIFVSRFFQKYLEGYLIQHALADLRRDLIRHICDLSLSFFNLRSHGDLLSRISTDLQVVSSSLQVVFGDLLQKPLTFAINCAMIFFINWKLALIVVLLFPLLYLIILKFGRKVRRRSRKQSSKRGLMTVALEQLFSGIRTVKSFSMERAEETHFEAKNQSLVREVMKTLRAKILSNSSVELASHLGIIIGLGVGGYYLINGQLGISIGDLIAFTAAVNTMYTPVKSLARAYTNIQESLGAMERVTEIFDERPTVIEAPDARPLPPFGSSIRFENVSFSYGREVVLQNIDLEIPANSLTAIVGPTGAGKSTLVDLILRFYDPTDGRILIDGIDIRTVTIDSLLSQVAIVSQDPFLFDTTIRENLLYGRSNATREEVEQAARMANIHEFILSLPRGYETEIGDRGALLSGGQRQRLTIARSLLKNAPILILDEATSSLDAESEAAVQDALEKLIEVRSTIAIAHRLSTIRNADQIIVLDHGRIVETGTYDGLIAARGLFFRLYSKQFAPGHERSEVEPRHQELPQDR